MTRLQEALEAVNRLAPTDRDNVARAILTLARTDVGAIDPEHLPYVLEGLADIQNGDFATEDEVAEAFRSFEQ